MNKWILGSLGVVGALFVFGRKKAQAEPEPLLSEGDELEDLIDMPPAPKPSPKPAPKVPAPSSPAPQPAPATEAPTGPRFPDPSYWIAVSPSGAIADRLSLLAETLRSMGPGAYFTEQLGGQWVTFAHDRDGVVRAYRGSK